MLTLFAFAFLILSTLFLIGMLLPNKVFLGRTSTRGKVAKVYGLGTLASFVVIGALAPKTDSSAGRETTIGKSATATEAAAVVATEEKEEEGKWRSAKFSGLMLPGRMQDAKATGFTNCKADYYGYKCTRAVPTELFGFKAQNAELTMDGSDYFADAYFTPVGPSGDVRELKAEQLAYGPITLTFARADYDSKCTGRNRQRTGSREDPISCITNQNTLAHVNQALLDAGWVLHVSKGGYQNYVHPRELVQITTKDNTATIRRISAKEVADLVASDEHLRAKQQAADSNAASVLEQMKQ